MEMGINISYVVYELNSVMDSSKHKALEEINFKGWRPNSFDTEEAAIQALIDDEKTYREYLILKRVFINA
jgi:hypothetical protein